LLLFENFQKGNGMEKIATSSLEYYFSLLWDLQLTVPENYNHSNQLASFSKKIRGSLYVLDPKINDLNFSKATTILEPKRKLIVKLFLLREKMWLNSSFCLELLHKEKAIFTGAQGASLVLEFLGNELPACKSFISLDEKNALYQCQNESSAPDCMLPRIKRESKNSWSFLTQKFNHPIRRKQGVLCFFDAIQVIKKI
jgi:hypothetical protein